MENIRQAVERARAGQVPGAQSSAAIVPEPATLRRSRSGSVEDQLRETKLKDAYLRSNRIVAHDSTEICAKPYDMLRTQVLRTMDLKGWKIIAVTSPTPACGKTLTAINLALSIARQPERSVLLLDVDLQRPRVATALGLSCNDGILSVLEGRVELRDAVIQARIGNHGLMILPAEAPTSDSSEWMTSRAISVSSRDSRPAADAVRR
jgi:Mrp family chromosome partitioning ATPase